MDRTQSAVSSATQVAAKPPQKLFYLVSKKNDLKGRGIQPQARYARNQKIDLDLSEQELVSCGPDGGCAGGSVEGGSSYVRDSGVVDEQCFPYVAADMPCEDTCVDGDRWSIESFEVFEKGIHDRHDVEYRLKKYLIEHGPLHMTLTNPYVVVLSGFGYDAEGPYWIIKDSGGDDDPYEGFEKKRYSTQILVEESKLSWRHYTNPIPPEGAGYNQYCTDRDWDGYCWWGVGERPPDCSEPHDLGEPGVNCCADYCAEEPDCDDGDNNKQICSESELLCGDLPLLQGGEAHSTLFGSYYYGNDTSCCGDNPGEEFAKNGLCCDSESDWRDTNRDICRENPKIVILSGTTNPPTTEQDLISVEPDETIYFQTTANMVDEQGQETPCPECTFEWYVDGELVGTGEEYTPGEPLAGIHEIKVKTDNGQGLQSEWAMEAWTGVQKIPINQDQMFFNLYDIKSITIDLSQNYLAYVRYIIEPDDEYFLYLHNIETGEEQLISHTPIDAVKKYPSFYEDKLAFFKGGGPGSRFKIYDLTSYLVDDVSLNFPSYLDVNWLDYYEPYIIVSGRYEDQELHIYTTQGESIKSILGTKRDYSLHDGMVAYSKQGTVYKHDIQNDFDYPISSDASDPSHPVIYKNHIVWDDIDGVQRDIYWFDGSNILQITDSETDQFMPEIEESFIVWYEKIDGVNNIHYYDTVTQESKKLVYGKTNYMGIDNGRVFFSMERNGKEDIYIVTLGDGSYVSCDVGQIIGDLNGDGEIESNDGTLLSNVIDNNLQIIEDICCADLTQDGLLGVDDLIYLNEILSGVSESPGVCPPPEPCEDTSHGECNGLDYCNDGTWLTDRCDLCGCPTGYQCEYQGMYHCKQREGYCLDGAPEGDCYGFRICNSNGDYVKPPYCESMGMPLGCWCPTGQDCLWLNEVSKSCQGDITEFCSDGTPEDSCNNEFQYCLDGELFNACWICGCPEGEVCKTLNNQPVQCVSYLCGDIDYSGTVDIDDIVWLSNYIFSIWPAPDPLEIGDVDMSGGIDIDDLVYLFTYVFQGGSAPCNPPQDYKSSGEYDDWTKQDVENFLNDLLV